MSEKFRNPIETNPEHVPTAEEVHAVFKELVDEEYTVIKQLEDEKGLYVLEIRIPGKVANERTEYEYMRKGHYQNSGIIETDINVVYYVDDVVISGTTAAKYRDGQWQILEVGKYDNSSK